MRDGNLILNKYFFKKCKISFKFLEKEYAYKFHEFIENKLLLTIIFKNNTTAVSITLDQRRGGVFVDLIRLINHNLPELPIEITKNKELNEFDLEDLLAIRKPDLKIKRPSLDEVVFLPGWENVISDLLNQYAIYLRKYAGDVLGGNFNVFKRLNKIVKNRSFPK